MQPQEDWKRELCEIIFSRKWTIFWTTVIIFAFALVVTIFMPPTYSAFGKIVVTGKPPRISPETLERLDVRIQSVTKEDLATEAEILSSLGLIRETLKGLEAEGVTMTKSASLLSMLGLDTTRLSSLQVDPFQRKVRAISEKMYTKIVPGANAVEVGVEGKDAEWNEKFLDSLMQEYLAFRSEVLRPKGEEAFFNKQAQKYRQELEGIEDKLNNASSEASATVVEREMTNNLDLKTELMTQLAALEDELLRKEKEIIPIKAAMEAKDVQYFAFIDNDTIRLLSVELLNLTAQRASALRDFRPDSPKIKALDENIRNIYKPLLNEIQKIVAAKEMELAALKERIDRKKKDINEIEKKNLDLQKVYTDFRRISREADLMAFSYETFMRRREEAQINSALSMNNMSGDVRIMESPTHTSQIVFPRPIFTPFIGLIAGLIAGFGLALLNEYLDHTIRRPADVRRLKLPVLCSLRKV